MGGLFGKKKKKNKSNDSSLNVNGSDANKQSTLIKVLTIGDSGVGKSSLLLRYSEDIFQEGYVSIGTDFKVKDITFNNNGDDTNLKVQIWDTAGQERFRTITSSYYRGAEIILASFDITKQDTFQNLQKWLQEVSRYADSNVTIVIVGCKNDLGSEREVTEDVAQKLAIDNGMKYVECSSKTGDNINLTINTALVEHFANKNRLEMGGAGRMDEF